MTGLAFEAIGTAWQIDIDAPLSSAEAERLRGRIMARIEEFDKTYSRFRADSVVTAMSRDAGVFALPDDARPMLGLYCDLYEKTGGLFTPLVGDMLSDAGYDAEYSLRQKRELAAAPSWDEALEYRHPNITVKKPVLLDFGAAGKGYLVDLVAVVIEREGYFAYCIDAGGDILAKGMQSIRVGLEDPEDPARAVGVATLADRSICGSAGNRRAWGDFKHIINPKTLVSPRGVLAVWVVAATGMLADALATCLFFVPPLTLAGFYEFEYVLVRSDRSVEISAGFPGEVFVS